LFLKEKRLKNLIGESCRLPAPSGVIGVVVAHNVPDVSAVAVDFALTDVGVTLDPAYVMV